MATIKHNLFFPHPAETVWEYLTTAELLEQWLMKNDFQPIAGHEFQFRVNPMPQVNSDGIFHCKVLEIVPLKKLSYSWKSGPGDGRIILDTLVVWTLQTKDNGTELSVEHSGFTETEDLGLYTGMNQGWISQMNKMATQINAKHGTTNP
jgi:uncharacterized protein YndB with AHSA1/START domain